MSESLRVEQELNLPFSVTSVPKARHFVDTELRNGGITSASVEDAVLIASELVGNAVRHARPLPGGGVTVVCSWSSEHVEVAVTDGGGATRPRVLHAPVSALGGRGLSIVDELTSQFGVRVDGPWSDGGEAVTVYAQVPRAGGAHA